MTTETPTTAETTDDPLRRYASDLLVLWALCGKPACRRARACKRDPRSCARRYGALVPEAARHGMLAMLQGVQAGAGLDELRACFPDDLAALEAWRAQIAAAIMGWAPDVGEQAQAGA